jgi:hypothetical protein
VRNELWRRARAVPSLDLRFADNKSLTDAVTGQSLVTFTRASSGTYVGSDGVIKTATTNEPRFDHNPTTGESLGLLVEEQRTNLLLRSEEFDNASWTKTAGSITADNTTAPTGNTTAELFTPTASSSFHACVQSLTVTASTPYTASVYIKGNGAPFAQLSYDNGASVGAWLNVNLSNGAITRGPEAAGGATGVSGSVTAMQNGWYRLAVTATHTGTVGRVLVMPLPSGSSTTGINATTTTATTDQIYLWGAQLEAGAFPTSYIPTTSATVTRSADVVSITGANFSSWYRQDEGTVFADINTAPVANIAQGIFDLSEGAGAERIFHRRNTTSFIVTAITDNSVVQGDFGSVSVSASGRARLGLAYRLNDFEAAVNGSSSGTDTSATVPTPDRIHIGQNFASGQSVNGTIRRLTYFPQRLSNSTLQAITQ